jgi:hypothetical protein
MLAQRRVVLRLADFACLLRTLGLLAANPLEPTVPN